VALDASHEEKEYETENARVLEMFVALSFLVQLYFSSEVSEGACANTLALADEDKTV